MKPQNVSELQDLVRTQSCLGFVGGGSKTALSNLDKMVEPVEMTGLAGIQEYEAEEYTFTALAGTRVKDVERELASNGQFLPFDPVLVDRGATLGGTVAAGLSGPGRFRYGGVRDFILWVEFVDGAGELVHAGGKVVKNSAGFDLPKWMAGSLGEYGALVQLTFKVFPRPDQYGSVCASYEKMEDAVNAMTRISRAPVDLYALDLLPVAQGVQLWARLGGQTAALAARLDRLCDLLGAGNVASQEEEANFWYQGREFSWLPEGTALVKVPLTPARLPILESSLAGLSVPRRYSVGGNLAWLGWPGEVETLDKLLTSLQFSGLVVLGSPERTRLGVKGGESFNRRVKQALDPQNKFWVRA